MKKKTKKKPAPRRVVHVLCGCPPPRASVRFYIFEADVGLEALQDFASGIGDAFRGLLVGIQAGQAAAAAETAPAPASG